MRGKGDAVSRKDAPAFLWGRSYVSECPFCRTLTGEYEREGCPHLKGILPLGREVFVFEG